MWHHVDCLGTPSDTAQDEYLEQRRLATPEYLETPKIILDVALQPTSRGGLKGFTAGNIRIVSIARRLSSSPEDRKSIETSPWMAAHLIEQEKVGVTDSEWENWLKGEFGMDEDESYEPLVVKDQLYYTCPVCTSDELI
jgi:hypothetical protein